MPIISNVGSKSLKVRIVYGAIYAVLTIGALSMIYPLMIMVSGSMKSHADFETQTPYPAYWFDDRILFQKYVNSKYVDYGTLETTWGRRVPHWNKIEFTDEKSPYIEEFMEWRKSCRWWVLGHSFTMGGLILPRNARYFREYVFKKYNGDLLNFREKCDFPAKSWNDVVPAPKSPFRYTIIDQPFMLEFLKFAETRPVEDRCIVDIDAVFWRTYLLPNYSENIATYNKQHKTDYKSYREIFLASRVPAQGLERQDWETFVRDKLGLSCVRIDPGVAENFGRFLGTRYSSIEQYNTRFKVQYKSFAEAFTREAPGERLSQVDWEAFLRDRKACPIEAVEVYGPRQSFEEFVAQKRNQPLEKIVPARLPIQEADERDLFAATSEWRWEFSTGNYKYVLNYILLHGRGLWNTFVYCVLAIGTTLIVNPLAAYSLSRYKPKGMYLVLLFCMATMAFPHEVTMIPVFLLQKQFPLWPLLGGIAATLTAFGIAGLLVPKWNEILRAMVGLSAGIVTGVWLVPSVMDKPCVSLLNTFAALVLPAMANGYSIFLLKGFFDSLPQELYEAAEIDGAGEWTKFWNITMNLSKPILAVKGLGAFTGAYSAFMMALIIIPDQDMWTLMVWLFQLQSKAYGSVVYAAIVLAAIPTMLIFLFCQNLIMRGIAVPVEK